MAKIRGVYQRTYGETVSYGIDYIHPVTGQRIRKILKGVTSEEDAATLRGIELADAHRGAIDKAYGLRSKVQAILFEDMIDEYVNWSKENKKSWKTDFFRGEVMKRFFKRKLMSDINPFMIEKYKMTRIKTISKVTVNKELILGNQIFQKAVDWKMFSGDNPFEGAEKFRIKKPQKPGSLTPEQVTAIRDEIKHSVKRDMVDFDFHTGWRISELRNLKWKDIDFKNGLAWITDPKNSQPVQLVLNDEALTIISRQTKTSDYVFCHKNGKRFKTNLHKVIKNAAKRAGVELPPRKAWHILRRTWASVMLQNGCDVETLRELGNWKDHSMPLWYANAGGSGHKKEILNKIPKLGNGTEMAPKNKVVHLTN